MAERRPSAPGDHGALSVSRRFQAESSHACHTPSLLYLPSLSVPLFCSRVVRLFSRFIILSPAIQVKSDLLVSPLFLASFALLLLILVKFSFDFAMAVDTGEGNEALQTVAPRAPVTYERPVSTQDIGIPQPHVPRALQAVDSKHPQGTGGKDTKGYSILQQHCAFFDRNGDGVIYPWETFAGFRAIGFNLIISFLGMVIINGAFSYITLDSWIPSPLFPIYLKNIHKAKHGSDSEVYDTEGRFVPSKFEELFQKFARSETNKLHFDELWALTNANRNAVDPFGWTAEKLEWGITYLLLKDQGGYVTKEQVRGMYDGSLFDSIAKQREQSKMHKKKL